MTRAISDLSAKIDPQRFQSSFGAGLDQLEQLVEAKTVTIAKLMEITPDGVADPTPHLYNETMYLMAFLLFLALIANALMKPVHPRHHMANNQ